MMNNELTARQQEIFDFMVSEIERVNRPPTIREIGNRFGISSPNGIVVHIKALARKGYIGVEPNTSRGITILRKPTPGIPLLTAADCTHSRLAELGVSLK
jgi:repressor LexA